MAKNPKKPIHTKKHLARMQRERRQRQFILLGSLFVILAVIALIAYGVLDQSVFKARRPVAVVNNDRITTRQFQDQTRYARYTLIRNAASTVQFMQYFGNDPSTSASFIQQLQQIKYQMDPQTIGKQVLDQLVDDELIRQYAKANNITVTQDEVNKAFQEAFGYFPNGTLTPTPTLEPFPTPTLSAAQQTMVAPAPTATPTLTPTLPVTATQSATATLAVTPTPVVTLTATPVITATPTVTTTTALTPTATPSPTLTPTPFTEEGYNKLYSDAIQNFKTQYNIPESALRYVVEAQLYREKVRKAIVGDLPREQEQVWVRHIVVPDEATAKTVYDLVTAPGANWDEIASKYSTDTFSPSGDLGWMTREIMQSQYSKEFTDAAFSLQAGQTAQPLQDTQGYEVIQAVGHATLPLAPNTYQQFQDVKFQDWLTEQKNNAKVTEYDAVWTEQVPADPTLPPEIDQIIQSAQQPQPTQPVILPTVESTTQPTQ